jgi:AraC family transcriptional regulator, regulatory protein of adaptative response / methylated-DNA-[protein]-cysteine methyltransferase
MTTTLATKKMHALPSVADDPRWARIVARDRTADEHLWYAVMTTGVYCRPSCPSRLANPKNIQLHDTLEAAKATGFRPCKRCNPDGPSSDCRKAAIVAQACRLIEQSEDEPSLTELAGAVGRGSSYFHHLFKSTMGLTPKGLRRRTSRGEGSKGPGKRQHRDRGDLRRRLQFERTFL